MAKRFTATEKWDDPFFFNLSNVEKLLWIFLLDKCDSAGIYDVNINVLNFYLKSKFTEQDILTFLGDKIQILNNRLMNARSIYLLTKTKSIQIIFRMPSLFYQGRDHNNFSVDKPTKYNLFWVKIRKIKNLIKR